MIVFWSVSVYIIIIIIIHFILLLFFKFGLIGMQYFATYQLPYLR